VFKRYLRDKYGENTADRALNTRSEKRATCERRRHVNYLNKNGRRFLDKTHFANFIKPEKSGKSWRYEKRESIRDGRTKRLIAEKASRKNAS